jgi:hypothetical protein
MHLVHNERTKLTASWLNTLATALVAAGAFAPFAAWLYGLSELPVSWPKLVGTALACGLIGMSLHVGGLALLGRLRE